MTWLSIVFLFASFVVFSTATTIIFIDYRRRKVEK